MPISTLTVLALYGELRDLSLTVENMVSTVEKAMQRMPYEDMPALLAAELVHLRNKQRAAERHAIEVILSDAPQINVNPLTGEAS